MGAFDGYIHILRGCELPTSHSQESYPFFKNQSSFNFFKGFGMPELKNLLAESEIKQYDTVWVPHERPGNGHIGLSVWYVRALIKEYDDQRTS